MNKDSKYKKIIKTFHDFSINPVTTDSRFIVSGKILSRAIVTRVTMIQSGVGASSGTPTTFRIQTNNPTNGYQTIFNSSYADLTDANPKGFGATGSTLVTEPSDVVLYISGGSGALDAGLVSVYIEYYDFHNLKEFNI